MRTPRVVILGAFLFTTIVLIGLSFRTSDKRQPLSTNSSDSPAGLRALYSFNTPLSLFPPNAIISLTDDNTTYFIARPAAFGPLLPAKGLDGELWIGSGFGADSLRQGGIVAGAEGEQGCSDVPGWMEGNKKVVIGGHLAPLPEKKKLQQVPEDTKSEKRKRGSEDAPGVRTADFGHLQAHAEPKPVPVNDGTDDYLHHHLIDSKTTKPGQNTNGISAGLQADHADIQSIQEGAEIAGKVVLLSRGGCGFLEKVKWVQRRGGIALIVGDNTKGGPLIQMYARGDTSNVTIPSVFTSWTTAHLLSKLIPPGSVGEDAVDENGKPIRKKPKKPTKKVSKHGSQSSDNKKAGSGRDKETGAKSSSGGGWFSFLHSKSKPNPDVKTETQKGKKDWVLVEEWDESSDSPKAAPNSEKSQPKDGFVIGEQDWRDPDLMEGDPKPTATALASKKSATERSGSSAAKSSNKASTKYSADVKGGSITPGSGQYRGGSSSTKVDTKDSKSQAINDKGPGSGNSGLVTKIFGDDEDESDVFSSAAVQAGSGVATELARDAQEDDEEFGHEGLWVTLTLTTGSSPFLDTLLVLVVSPLVTLSVVYALLLIRSRIRRRRWRAPKSVVERLPVRTYQTVRSVVHSRLPSPIPPSVTTPLLHDSSVRPRPRSQTTSGIPEPGELLRTNSNSSQISRAPSPRIPTRAPEHEKNVTSEWKKYMGKQVECVVCLEEYIDGVSRVMSLPCGHEFHVDCITPWLTTRRRTCPICKGDVVRSLARGSPSTPRYDAYQDDSDDDIQAQAAETVNSSSSSALPIPTNNNGGNTDLESGIISPTPSRPRRNNLAGSWRTLLSSSIGSSSRSPRATPEDRNR